MSGNLNTDSVKIADREVGLGHPAYIVAEMSANHCRDFPIAARTVIAAKEAGADAIKVQAYTPDTLTLDSDAEPFIAGGIWKGRKLYDLYADAALPWDMIPRLKKLADDVGIHFFSTVYDISSVEFLEEEIDPPVYKVASFELTDMPLLRRVAQTGKPVILSVGMATEEEIREAVRTLYQYGAGGVVLLKCTSAYPAKAEDQNLATMVDMMRKFGVPVGFSDHTPGISSSTAAAALQACMIEKHFRLDHVVNSPDSAFSITPQAMKALVTTVRLAQASVGSVIYGHPSEDDMKKYRRSIFVVKEMRAGQRFTKCDIKVLRPAVGVGPGQYDLVLESVATMAIKPNTPLTKGMFGSRVPVRAKKPPKKSKAKLGGSRKRKVKPK